jgi:HAD superfamily hydrolase (TIGR01509 family)
MSLPPPPPRRPLAVIFDMDGTLLDTEAVHRVTMRAAARDMGQDLSDALFLELVGVHREENYRRLRHQWGEDFPIEAFYARSDEAFEAMWRQGVPFRPGAVALLDGLAALGLPLGLCTSTASPFAEERLEAAGILGRFDAIVTRSDVEHPKPHPDPYLLAARRLGQNPADCVAVEDSPNGLRAGAAAGMMALLIPDLAPATVETRALATAVLPDLTAVGSWIGAALA